LEQQYKDGYEIHTGDRISYNGQIGNIVFVSDRKEYTPDYPESQWPISEYPTGFMIEFTNGAKLFLEAPDDRLERQEKINDLSHT